MDTSLRPARARRRHVLLTVSSLLAAATVAHGFGPPLVDLNLANQAELEMVKGIGPQLSERILAERARGRFVDWADFTERMKGIGPHHATRLSAAGLRISGQAYAPSGDRSESSAK
jgi:competence protein ComEA